MNFSHGIGTENLLANVNCSGVQAEAEGKKDVKASSIPLPLAIPSIGPPPEL